MKKTNIEIKSNVMLKEKGRIHPVDLFPRGYFDTRSKHHLTPKEKLIMEKMLFWAETIKDEFGNIVVDDCFKGCANCGDVNNDCNRPTNRKNKL